jgi:hypothetical protein
MTQQGLEEHCKYRMPKPALHHAVSLQHKVSAKKYQYEFDLQAVYCYFMHDTFF